PHESDRLLQLPDALIQMPYRQLQLDARNLRQSSIGAQQDLLFMSLGIDLQKCPAEVLVWQKIIQRLKFYLLLGNHGGPFVKGGGRIVDVMERAENRIFRDIDLRGPGAVAKTKIVSFPGQPLRCVG